MPHDLIFLTLGRVQSQFQREEEYLLFWVPSILVTTPHSTVIAARHISDNICVNELRNALEVACTN